MVRGMTDIARLYLRVIFLPFFPLFYALFLFLYVRVYVPTRTYIRIDYYIALYNYARTQPLVVSRPRKKCTLIFHVYVMSVRPMTRIVQVECISIEMPFVFSH